MLLIGVNSKKNYKIEKYDNEVDLPEIGTSTTCYFIENSGNPFLKYWNGIEYLNSSDREDEINAVSDYFRDYYAKYSDIDISKYNGSTRDILVIEDENNSLQSTSYLFNGSILTTIPKSILDRIEALEYILIQVLTFTNNVNVVQKGSTVTSVTFGFSFNKVPVSISINNGIGSITPTSATSKTSIVIITANTTFTISASDGQNTATRTTSIRFDNTMFFGSSPVTTLSNSQILALQNSVLVNSRQRTVTLAGNAEHPVIAYPKSLGLPTFIMAGLENTDWTITEQNVTNSDSFTEAYYVCVMNTIQNSPSIAITIQ